MSRAPIVGIAGVGLIGASIGLRATACGYDVLGWDRDPAAAGVAFERRAIARIAPTFAQLAERAETLVLATPLDGTLSLLRELARYPPGATLVLDVASVKGAVARAAAPLPAFVATHPIAGSERSGPAAARADLFAGRIWTYDPGAADVAVTACRAFIGDMGARPYALANEEHDRIIALTSHLPQVLAVVLGARLGPELERPDVVALCGTGIRSMLRLGESAWPIWRAIVEANGGSIAQEVRKLAGDLSAVADALDAARHDGLAADFVTAADAVARLRVNASDSGPGEPAPPATPERQTWIDGSHSAPH